MTESVYFEKLTLWQFAVGWWRYGAVRRAARGQSARIYYIDISRAGTRVLLPLLKWTGAEISRVEFEMRDIKDERGELVRLRIARQDLFDLKAKIVASDEYRALTRYDSDWQAERVKDYVDKALVDVAIWDENTAARTLFVIEVVNHHRAGTDASPNLLIMRTRPWFELYRAVAARYQIDIAAIGASPIDWIDVSALRRILYRFPRLYTVVRTRKEHGTVALAKRQATRRPMLYVDGRGDVTLENNGHHSDFFWYFNSEFPAANIIYPHRSEQEERVLTEHGIALVSDRVALGGPLPVGRPRYAANAAREYRVVNAVLRSYRSTRAYWRSVFRAHNVKVWLTWYKYDNFHMAAADAVEDNGGISVCWPIAFDGHRYIDSLSSTDILFSYSQFSADIARQSGSTWSYNVIVGYTRDYAGPLLRREAQELRNKLEQHGAKHVVLVVDENSLDDARWHTGHALQRENYRAILEKLMDTPSLGVIFKPKTARTLRRRLGPVAELLAAAEKTGRCFVYEASGRGTTSAPPLLAGLASDVCVHAHLGAGTAALECALEGIPTLLIDREGTPDNKLHELPAGTVVFTNWPDTIDALMRHFNTPGGIPGFGDWSSILDELDPFRDGLAAARIGTYLQWLIEGFEQGMQPAAVMAAAAEQYGQRWGYDKILSAQQSA